MFEFLKTIFSRAGSGAKDSKTSFTKPSDATRLSIENLHESEEHFAQLVANVRDYAVFLLDPDGKILTWNAGAEHIKGYRAEEIIGQSIHRFYPKEAVAAGWPDHELEVAGETGRFEDEGWRLRKDGTKFWASVVITALRGENGAIRGFLKITRDLTDRKHAEEKLRLSEERFRLLVEGVKDYAIYMLDPTGRVVTWNEGAQRLKQYTSDEIIGEHFSRFYPAEANERKWPEEELKRAVADGRFEDEGWRVRKDGTQFWANVVITSLRDERGKQLGFAKVTRDLTLRRAAEENAQRLAREEAARLAAESASREIERQREQLQVTLASIGDAVIVTNERGEVTFLNAVAAKLTGWKNEEAADQALDRVFPIIHEETRQPVENPVNKAFRERSVVLLANHTSLVTRDGVEISIEDSAAPIWDRDGEICGAVLVFRDVTETRRSVDARLRLAAIVESSDDAIIGESLDGHISSWNRGAEWLYGYKPAEAIGQPLSILVPIDHRDEQPDLLERIQRGESVQHFETVRLRKNGDRIEVSLSISPIRDGEGKIVGASKIARDITARRNDDRRKSEFLALLAHELRNPLAPLRNTLQIMRLAANDESAVTQARSIMERQLQHLVRLVDDLLDISRINEGKLRLRKQRILLSDVVKNALEVCSQAVEQEGRQICVSFPEQPVYLDADGMRLTQAICNLLNNAVKYSEPGTPIQLIAELAENDIKIKVKDEGVGLPEQMLTKVFDMFTQVDRSLEKSQGGLGIGLSIVKNLIELHNGTVEAKSEGLGKGSEFLICLPIAQVVRQLHVPENGQPPPSTSGHRILVVDDNVDAADTLSMMLRLMGNEVHTAHDGVIGTQIADSVCPDLVLLDIGMPKLNGYDACRQMRGQPWGKTAKIIALTGWGQDDDKQRSQEAGFDGHLVKPIGPSDLENLLASLN